MYRAGDLSVRTGRIAIVDGGQRRPGALQVVVNPAANLIVFSHVSD